MQMLNLPVTLEPGDVLDGTGAIWWVHGDKALVVPRARARLRTAAKARKREKITTSSPVVSVAHSGPATVRNMYIVV